MIVNEINEKGASMFNFRLHHIAGNYGVINRLYFFVGRRANWTRPVHIIQVNGWWIRVES